MSVEIFNPSSVSAQIACLAKRIALGTEEGLSENVVSAEDHAKFGGGLDDLPRGVIECERMWTRQDVVNEIQTLLVHNLIYGIDSIPALSNYFHGFLWGDVLYNEDSHKKESLKTADYVWRTDEGYVFAKRVIKDATPWHYMLSGTFLSRINGYNGEGDPSSHTTVQQKK